MAAALLSLDEVTRLLHIHENDGDLDSDHLSERL